jgi:hypothetical protein
MFDYGLGKNKITYVKDEGLNLKTMTTTLISIVRCESLGLDKSFQGTYFCFVLSKAYQYVIIDENFRFVSINFT